MELPLLDQQFGRDFSANCEGQESLWCSGFSWRQQLLPLGLFQQIPVQAFPGIS
jgi:hypothetical protein